jgi:hypothetical protein
MRVPSSTTTFLEEEAMVLSFFFLSAACVAIRAPVSAEVESRFLRIYF